MTIREKSDDACRKTESAVRIVCIMGVAKVHAELQDLWKPSSIITDIRLYLQLEEASTSKYSRLSLSRLRLSRITAYLEEKT